MMGEQELNNLLDKAIGTKGNLQIHSYWMHKILTSMQSLLIDSLKNKTDSLKYYIDEKIPKNISDLYNDVDYATKNQYNSLLSEINIINSRVNFTYQDKESYDLSFTKDKTLIVNCNIIPNNKIINILQLDTYECRMIAITKNISFKGSKYEINVITSTFTSEEYAVYEYSFRNISGKIFITRKLLGPINLIMIEPEDKTKGFSLWASERIQFPNSNVYVAKNSDDYVYNTFNNRSNPIPTDDLYCTYTLTDFVPDFNGMINIKKIIFSEGIKGVYDLKYFGNNTIEFVFPSTCENLEGASAFEYGSMILDFRSVKKIPSITSKHVGDLTIIVPDELYSDWVYDDKWRIHSSQIITASAYDNQQPSELDA